MKLHAFLTASSILLLAGSAVWAQVPKFGPGPAAGVTPGYPLTPEQAAARGITLPANAASSPASAASAPVQPASAPAKPASAASAAQ